MTGEISLICGNWGTTSLRAFALNAQGMQVGHVRHGAGVGQVSKADQEAVWGQLVSDWANAAPQARHLLCGGAGSNLGWLETGYVDCPAGVEAVRDAIAWRDWRGHRLGIVPGLRAPGFIGGHDTMRSEETEVFGWLARNPALQDGLVCLPGTHTKWVAVRARAICGVFTGYVGELLASLRTGSVLTRGSAEVTLGPAFEAGADLALTAAPGSLVHRLMHVRTEQIFGRLSAQDSASFLSGLLVASDVAGAREIAGAGDAPVTIIAGEAAGASYARVFARLGWACQRIEAGEASAAGFAALGLGAAGSAN